MYVHIMKIIGATELQKGEYIG